MPAMNPFLPGAKGQRHHKHRVGRLLVPHSHVSGLVFSVNPRQEGKALRELQLYLHPLIADLEKQEHEEEERQRTTAPAKGHTPHGKKTEDPTNDDALAEERGPLEELERAMVPSTSSLLAAELAACTAGRTWKARGGADEDADHLPNSDEADGGEHEGIAGANSSFTRESRKRPRSAQEKRTHTHQWLAPLETGCKGHLMVSIPFPLHMRREGAADTRQTVEDKVELNESGSALGSKEGEVKEAGGDGGSGIPHSIIVNPLVGTVVERIFKDMEENPRPVLRNCFRLLPCELTCCPTLPEMRLALCRLVESHFPSNTENQNHTTTTATTTKLHRVSFSFKVKNNTSVESKKSYLQAALEASFPVNRFVVVSAGRLKEVTGSSGGVEAMFCALVAHATCVMGVQREYSRRGEYNLHAMGAKHLELSNSV